MLHRSEQETRTHTHTKQDGTNNIHTQRHTHTPDAYVCMYVYIILSNKHFNKVTKHHIIVLKRERENEKQYVKFLKQNPVSLLSSLSHHDKYMPIAKPSSRAMRIRTIASADIPDPSDQ